MTNQIRLTTTGLANPVNIFDLGDVNFAHPTSNYVLNDTSIDNPAFSLDELYNSYDLQESIDLGYISIDNENYVNITNIKDYIKPVVKYNRIIVDKNPSASSFQTIYDALQSISGSSYFNRFIIDVNVGEYIEQELDFASKPYVSLVGKAIQSVVIKPAGNHHIMKLGELNEVSFVWLEDAPLGYAGIAVLDSGDYSQCHKVTFLNCDIGILIESSTQDTFFYGEYIDMNGEFTHAVKMSSSNGFICYANLENFYIYPESSNPSRQGVYLTGNKTECYINACGIKGTDDDTGFYIQDGAELNFNSGYISHLGIGIQNANVGSPATILLTAAEFHENIIKDIEILHPTTVGSFGGSSDHTMINNQSPNFVWLFLDSNDGELDATRKISVTFEDGTHTDLSTLLFEGSTMGVLEGGHLSDGGGLNVYVDGGFGYLDDNTIIKRFDWSGTTVALTATSDNFIYINDLGVLVAAISAPATLHTVIYLGRVRTHSSGIEFIDSSQMSAHHIGNALSTFNRVALGNIYARGSEVSEGTALKLNVNAGIYFRSEYIFTPSGGTDITFTQYHHNGTSAWTRTSTDTVNNTHYNSGNNYTVLSTGFYTKHSLYVIGGNGNEQYMLVLGQSEHATLGDAQTSDLPSQPTYFDKGVTLIAVIYVQEGNGNIVLIEDARPIIGFKPITSAGVTEHSALTGLGNDDHSIYLLANGGRIMSGHLNMGGNNITNVNLVDGVDVSTHASRHLPNGADPLTTGIPSTIGTANAEGIQNAYARQDHVHNHGNQTDPNHHALATQSVHGFMSSSDKTKLDAISGTNTGDQTTISGITGTKTEFNAACTDGNFLYVGDITQYTDENAQDAVGSILDSTLVYDDSTPLLMRAALSGDVTALQGSNLVNVNQDAITNAKLANMDASTFKGRITAGVGDPEDLTGTQATTLLDVFTSLLKGLVPASGGGTSNFLRADGTWSAPSSTPLTINSVNAAGNITTSNAADVVATSMTISPAAGTYLALFSTNISHSNSNGTINMSIYVNSVQVTNSARVYTQPVNNASTVTTSHAFLLAVVTVGAGQAVDVRWNRGGGGGTATMGNRCLALIK